MFSNADRLPTGPRRHAITEPVSPRPWALTLMQRYPSIAEMPYCSVTLDPDTQTGLYFDARGSLVEMNHRKTNRATEQKTRVSKGDGNSPKSYDDDTSQD